MGLTRKIVVRNGARLQQRELLSKVENMTRTEETWTLDRHESHMSRDTRLFSTTLDLPSRDLDKVLSASGRVGIPSMASGVFPEKRTRSQLALPDDLLLQLSQGSPLKDARTALRHINATVQAATIDHRNIVDETDDGLSLLPGKPIPASHTAKRSVSPLPGDEYAFRPQSPSDGRELKRTKLDDEEVLPRNPQPFNKTTQVLSSRPAHTRSLSQPTYSKDATRARSGTTNGSSTDASSGNICGGTELTGIGRARSVPLFPSSLPSGIVHIDLRNPPASPRRQKSVSPSKERELRIFPRPAVSVKLDAIQDEADSTTNDEQGFNPIPQPITCDSKNLIADVPPAENKLTSGIILEEPIPPPTPSKKRPTPLVLSVIVEPPATPLKELSPLSPLTPISDTPLPSNSASEDIRYVASRSAISPPEEVSMSFTAV